MNAYEINIESMSDEEMDDFAARINAEAALERAMMSEYSKPQLSTVADGEPF
jgi:hypothetical protein